MRRFYYRHSRGFTEVAVGWSPRYEDFAPNPVLIIEEGLEPPLKAPVLRLRGGEEVKSFDSLIEVFKFLSEIGADRSTHLVAVGGGALLDLATFAAGTYMRGMGLVNVPTTLLSMVDAALGGKGAVDVGPVKNLVGVFYQPKAIVCDLRWLSTLPERTYRSGLAEAVKYGVSLDADFFHWLVENIEGILRREREVLEELIYRSLSIKASVVEIDEFEERGIRVVLNVGHTVGHAIERVLGISHGEAVAIGMVAELTLFEELGYTEKGIAADTARLLQSLGLPVKATASAEALEKAKALLRYDKKRRGEHITVPVVVRLGKWIPERMPIRQLEKAVELAFA